MLNTATSGPALIPFETSGASFLPKMDASRVVNHPVSDLLVADWSQPFEMQWPIYSVNRLVLTFSIYSLRMDSGEDSEDLGLQ